MGDSVSTFNLRTCFNPSFIRIDITLIACVLLLQRSPQAFARFPDGPGITNLRKHRRKIMHS